MLPLAIDGASLAPVRISGSLISAAVSSATVWTASGSPATRQAPSAHLVWEKITDATCYGFYTDMRAFGEGSEESAERIKARGTFTVRGRTAKVAEITGQTVATGEDLVSDRLVPRAALLRRPPSRE